MTIVPAEVVLEPVLDEQPSPRGDAQLHGTLLGLSTVVLLLSALLQVPDETSVLVPIAKLALPEVCSYKRLTGKDCPGCGLTRCFISLAHGQWRRAWHFNPAGIYFFAIVVAQIPYRALQLWRVNRGRAEWSANRLTACVLISLTAALLTQWIVRACA